MRAADQLIQTLTDLDTEHIFSLSGNQIMSIYDAWLDSDINLLHTRHESGAVHMADAYGRLSGKPGVVLIAGGPGFSNALSAMYVAQMAESPIVVLSGHVPLETYGKGNFQEMPQAEIAKAYSKASWLLEDPNAIDRDLRRAFAIAMDGRPGPVHIALPTDVIDAQIDALLPADAYSPTPHPSAENIETIIRALNAASRPLIIAGSAVMRSAEFAAAAKTLAAANIAVIGTESPRGINDPSLGAFASVVAQADLLVLVGKKLDFTLRYGEAPTIRKGTKIIQIDADADVLELTRHNGTALEHIELAEANPYHAIEAIGQAITSLQLDEGWALEVENAIQHVPPAWDEMRSKKGEAMFSAETCRTIHNYLAETEDSIMITDGGEFGQWAQAFIKPPHRVINGMSGSIGVAVPMGLAARLAYSDSRIVVCSGDGGFGFLPFELETAVRSNLPFTTVIGNDARWNAEYQIQLRNYGTDRVGGVELEQTKYHEVVQALGGWGAQVTDVDGLQEALISAKKSNLPACINAIIRGEAAPKIEL